MNLNFIIVFDHKNIFRKIWDILIYFLILYIGIELPVIVVLDYSLFGIDKFLFPIMFYIFILDILINFNTSYDQDGHNIKDRKKIAVRYLKTWFLIDLVAIIPFSLFFQEIDGSENLFKLIRLVRLFKLSYLSEFGSKYFDPLMFRLFTFVLWVVHITHWTACGWIYIDGVDRTSAKIDQYVDAFYWSTTTLTTVGYGDMTPSNITQKLFTITIMFIGIGMYAYVIGNIATVLTNLNVAKSLHTSKLQEISAFLRYKRVPKELQKKITDYYQYIWDKRLLQYQGDVLNDLPKPFQQELALFINQDFIEKVPMFKNANSRLIKEIVLELKPVLFGPEDIIFEQGDDASCMYFINSGSVQIINEDQNSIIATLAEGSFFGEMALLSNMKRSATIRAKTYCELHVLEKDSFDRVLEKHPHFAEAVRKTSNLRTQKNKNSLLDES